MEKKPDLSLKNKKGQSPIDITNSKVIISLFWNYLTGGSKQTKTLMTTKNGRPLSRLDPFKKPERNAINENYNSHYKTKVQKEDKKVNKENISENSLTMVYELIILGFKSKYQFKIYSYDK